MIIINTLIFITVFVALSYMIFIYYHKIQLMYNSAGLSMYTPDTFSIRGGCENKVNDKFIKGKDISKHKRIIIVSLLKNAANEVSTIIKKTEKIGDNFKDYRVLIVENDSNDNTRNHLLTWAKNNPRVTILGCGINAPECKMPSISGNIADKQSIVNRSRISKMVDLRNIPINYIKNSAELKDFDYTIVWDLDIIGSVYIDGIYDSIYELENNKGLSCMCAYGIYRWLGILPIYYDTYAHINAGEKPFHLKDKAAHDLKTAFTEGLKYMRGDDITPVTSCFSGFSIYRLKDLLHPGVTYTMTPDSDTNIECEHVRFHKTLPGKIAMNPNMINLVLLNK